MSAIKNELINSLNNNQSLEGMKQLSIDELDLISVLIGTCLGLELAKLIPDNEKIAQLNKLNGTIILMKTELKHTESNQ